MSHRQGSFTKNPCESCALGCVNEDGEVASCLAGLRIARRNWDETRTGILEFEGCQAKIEGHPATRRLGVISHNSEYSEAPEIVVAVVQAAPKGGPLSGVVERASRAKEEKLPLHCLRVLDSIQAVKNIPSASEGMSVIKARFVSALAEYISDAHEDHIAMSYMKTDSPKETAMGISLAHALARKSSSN